MKFAFERGVLEEKYITSYCKGNWNICIQYQKEEAGIYHPDNMRQDGVIDENLS
ncbi:MAG: uracil-DNA glycosylase [Spirochaetes bacterium]|nr:MAG: uracil-DNA glycosylase [Spirochaetota bacterium]